MKVKKLIWLFVATLSLWSCNEEDEGYPIATNRGPVMLAQSFNPLENISDTDIIGTIKAFDADGDALSYSLTMNDGDMFFIISQILIDRFCFFYLPLIVVLLRQLYLFLILRINLSS